MLTRRGKRVRAILLALMLALALYGLIWVSTNLWWTGTGWCLGSFITCNALNL